MARTGHATAKGLKGNLSSSSLNRVFLSFLSAVASSWQEEVRQKGVSDLGAYMAGSARDGKLQVHELPCLWCSSGEGILFAMKTF